MFFNFQLKSSGWLLLSTHRQRHLICFTVFIGATLTRARHPTTHSQTLTRPQRRHGRPLTKSSK